MKIWKVYFRPTLLLVILLLQYSTLYTQAIPEAQANKDYTSYIEIVPGIPKAPILPKTHTLQVPFSPQAPLGDWNAPYQEACEEMSLILVDYYLRNLDITKDLADQEVLLLTNWIEESGFKHSINIEQTARVAKQYFGYNSRIISNPTIEDIKNEIAKGNPVIVPAAGKKLPNPYFVGQGPVYHMFIITGYTETDFITNEVGTTFGQGFIYNQQTTLDAIADWTGDDTTIESGDKKVLVLEKY